MNCHLIENMDVLGVKEICAEISSTHIFDVQFLNCKAILVGNCLANFVLDLFTDMNQVNFQLLQIDSGRFPLHLPVVR